MSKESSRTDKYDNSVKWCGITFVSCDSDRTVYVVPDIKEEARFKRYKSILLVWCVAVVLLLGVNIYIYNKPITIREAYDRICEDITFIKKNGITDVCLEVE